MTRTQTHSKDSYLQTASPLKKSPRLQRSKLITAFKRNMSRYSLILFILSIGLVSGHASGPETTFTLKIEARGARSNVGQALFALFTTKENFLKDPVISSKQAIDDSGMAWFQIEGLEAGSYAVSVVYDEDSNGKLNTGFLGIPKEKVGVSNNPKARFGPPKFKDSVFELTEDTTLVIILGDAS